MRGAARPRRRSKLSKPEILRRLRLGDLRRLIGDRCRGPVLPDDDAGREYLRELLLPISLGPHEAVKASRAIEVWGPTNRMRREIESWAPWMSDDEAQEIIDEINLTPEWQRRPMAATLGRRLNVPYGERARLGLRTIGPCDTTPAALAAIRRQKDRRRKKLLRQRKPRAEYLAASLSQTKPWLALGISRRTWERRRDASVSAINLLSTEDRLATETKTGADAGDVGRVPRPTPAWQRQTYADGFMTERDAAWLVDAITTSELARASMH
jgi:hypothetical protein